jgi:hypothetical protein
VFNTISDVVNYVVFVVVNLVIDVNLIEQMRKTIEQKKAKLQNNMNNMSVAPSKQPQQLKAMNDDGNKKKKEEDPVQRTIDMVVFYTVLDFLLKLPIALISLNDLILIITRDYSALDVTDLTHYFDFEYFMKHICSASRICQVMKKIAYLLFLVSFAINLLFYYKYDKKFKLAYQRLIFPSKTKVTKEKASKPGK